MKIDLPMGQPVLHFRYQEWHKSTSMRRAIPISILFGIMDFGTQPQWLMVALDVDSGDHCRFAMKDMDQITEA